METATSYGAVARLCHWLTVVSLLVIMPIGLVMGDLPRGLLQDTLFVTHESLGLTILGLTAVRLLWRLTHQPPPPSRDLSPLEVRASGSVHILLYVVLMVMPVTGYLFVTYSGIALHYFGLARVPALVTPDKPTGELFLAVHVALQWAIYGLALMHIGAALHHFFVRRNDVLSRMIPGLRGRAPARVQLQKSHSRR
jgi:cytochrome b561